MNDRRPDSRRDNRIRLIRPVAGIEGLSAPTTLARTMGWLYLSQTIDEYTT